MKKILFIISLFTIAGLALACSTQDAKVVEDSAKPTLTATKVHSGPIRWMTWNEAIKANEKEKKKIFIDFYTNWCGWCKKMDNTTFANSEVAAYINENFYPVKFNAEQKQDIEFQGTVFKFRPGGRRGGVHMLAAELLNGRLGYPSYVYLTPEYERILISPGYKPANDMLRELKFVAEEHYTHMTWDAYRRKSE
ncbi:MAG TPA: DUF255 domain-containing protein [Bacteroidetes bacterium]|nr:DUF255 domain-containing protein [Bacteroidota bacterium]